MGRNREVDGRCTSAWGPHHFRLEPCVCHTAHGNYLRRRRALQPSADASWIETATIRDGDPLFGRDSRIPARRLASTARLTPLFYKYAASGPR